MYIIEEKDDLFIKYEIHIDFLQLRKLRRRVIDECSEISHVEEIVEHTPNQYNFDHIRNYRKSKVGIPKHQNNDEALYYVEYDYYKHPELVLLIDKLLEENCIPEVIQKLKNQPSFCISEEDIKLKNQKELLDELIKQNNKSYSSQGMKRIQLATKEYLNMVDKKIEQDELNKDKKSVLPYYLFVLDCITEVIIDAKDKEEVLNAFGILGNEEDSKQIPLEKLKTLFK